MDDEISSIFLSMLAALNEVDFSIELDSARLNDPFNLVNVCVVAKAEVFVLSRPKGTFVDGVQYRLLCLLLLCYIVAT